MKKLQRLTATILALAVVLLTPGLDAYAAAGKTFSTEGTPSAADLPALGASAIPGAGQAVDVSAPGLSTDLSAAQTGAPAAAAAPQGAESVSASAGDAEAAASGVDAAATAAAQASAQSGEVSESKVADAAKINSGLRGLFSAFRKKSAEDVPAAGPAASNGSSMRGTALGRLTAFLGRRSSAQAGLPTPDPEKALAEQRGTALQTTIYSSLSTQAGYETATSLVPYASSSLFHDVSKTADLMIIGSIASIVGSVVSPLIVSRMSLKGAYLGMTAATLGMAVALIGISAVAVGSPALMAGAAFPAMAGIMFLFRLTQAASGAAERNIPPELMRDLSQATRQAQLGTYKGRKQVWAEVASVSTQNGVGALVAALGFLPVMLISPAMYAVALGFIYFKLFIPVSVEDARKATQAANAGANPTLKGQLKKFWREITDGTRYVASEPKLRLLLGAASVFMIYNQLMYGLVSTAFGMYNVGLAAGTNAAGPIAGLIAGIFSFGGLYTGRKLARQEADLARQYPDEHERHEAQRQQNVSWLKRAGLSFSAFTLFALPWGAGAHGFMDSVLTSAASTLHMSVAALIGVVLGLGTVTAVWRPLVGGLLVASIVAIGFSPLVAMAALGTFVFGYIQFGASLRTDGFYESVAGEKVADAIGAIGAWSRLASVIAIAAFSLIVWGKMPFVGKLSSSFGGVIEMTSLTLFGHTFTFAQGHLAFIVFALAALPAGAALWYIASRLDALTKPQPNTGDKNAKN